MCSKDKLCIFNKNSREEKENGLSLIVVISNGSWLSLGHFSTIYKVIEF
jgi:hypothetical protein